MSDDDFETWWKSIGAGLLLLGASAFLFWYFTNLETSGGTGRIHWIIAILYNVGGKWVVCSLFGLLGIFAIGLGIKQWKDEQ